ncbi:hypothetical protein TB2_013515 [Malus domestica]
MYWFCVIVGSASGQHDCIVKNTGAVGASIMYVTSSLNKGNEREAGIAPSFCLPGDIHRRGMLPVSDSTNCRHKGILKNYT